MYFVRGDARFDVVSLRQGDVLKGIPFPLLESGSIQVLGITAQDHDFIGPLRISPETHQHRDDPEWVTIQVPARFGLCAVLSNCCDLEPRGGKVQAHAVTLARLRPISNDLRNSAERFSSLTANKDPRDPNDPGYIDLFYLEPHRLLHNQDWVVHYNQVVTIPTSDIALLMERKVIQLDDRTRMKFKIKLAFTLGRPNEEELNAGLENPWREPPPQQDAPAAPAGEPEAPA